jgi:competence protein ComFC
VASFGHFGRQLEAWLEVAGDAVVSVIYPAGCCLCDQLLTRATRLPICEECLASFAALPPPVCDICGSPVVTLFAFALNALKPVTVAACQEASMASARFESRSRGCLGCLGRTFAFERARSYAAYEGRLIRAIVMLKFERIEPLAVWFAERLANVVQREHLAADIVVPVALHRQRESERGYNQADLIARPLARKLGLPYRAVLLMRTKPRPDKHILSLSERWESVRGAFATRLGSQVDNLRVLLVDDVLTTGATLDACAKALRQAGAKAVIGLTVARAVRHPVSVSDEL